MTDELDLNGLEYRIRNQPAGDPVRLTVGGLRALIAAAKEAEELREELSIWKSVFPDIAPESVQPDRSKLEADLASLRALLVRAGEDVKCKIAEAEEQCARHAPMGGINYLSWFGRLVGLKYALAAITRATQTDTTDTETGK